MQHKDVVDGYRAGQLKLHIDRNQAGHVCDNHPMLPRRYKLAHALWGWIALRAVAGGLISIFWVTWWIGLGIAALGPFAMPAVQRSSAEFVLEYSLEDAAFFEDMVHSGVIVVDPAV